MSAYVKTKKKKLGLVVNPVAGLGGRVGLKGTDGENVVDEARQLGAIPESPQRASEALRVVAKIKGDIELYCYPYEMGEFEARESGFVPNVVGLINRGRTTSEDTCRAAFELRDLGVDLLLFAGGDGTARDIYRSVGHSLTVLGIPAGVKMHSAVFALNARNAGEAAVSFLTNSNPAVAEVEVMDIDEGSFRKGVVAAKLYGYLRAPQATHYMQSAKSGGFETDKQVIQGIASELAGSIEKDCLSIYGPGTTTRDVLAQFGMDKTLLGIDVVLGDRVIARDVNEKEILGLIGNRKKLKIVVTVIGQQGYIFGRGNQQLSPEIIKKAGKDNIVVIASKEKLASLQGRPLLVDTGSDEVNEKLRGYMRVITGYNDYVVYKVN
jgi:predicted polyphosphate/ATP-dependent NAD kinase